MCKLNNIKDKQFIVYKIINENYVGVTTNLHKRLLKHKSKSNFDISEIGILLQTTDLQSALNTEKYYQEKFKCKLGVRNQNGLKNPYAKQVLHLETGIFFDTIKEACEALNINYVNCRACLSNKNNKYKLIKIN